MKSVRKIILAVITMLSIVYCAVPVSAEYLYTGYTFKKIKGITNPVVYVGKIYKDRDLHEMELMAISPMQKHVKGEKTKLDFYRSIRYPGEYTGVYNRRFVAKEKAWAIGEVLRFIGGGMRIRSNYLNAVGYPGYILRDEQTGYYRLSLCQKFMKFQVKMYAKDGRCVDSIEVYAPTGNNYIMARYGGQDSSNVKF